MSLQEDEDQKVRRDLQALGRHVDRQLPFGWGFVVLAFAFGEGRRMNYISNADRADIVRAMYEFIAATKEGPWGSHLPQMEAGTQAGDELIGRLRQQVAQLERQLSRALEKLEKLERL